MGRKETDLGKWTGGRKRRKKSDFPSTSFPPRGESRAEDKITKGKGEIYLGIRTDALLSLPSTTILEEQRPESPAENSHSLRKRRENIFPLHAYPALENGRSENKQYERGILI